MNIRRVKFLTKERVNQPFWTKNMFLPTMFHHSSDSAENYNSCQNFLDDF